MKLTIREIIHVNIAITNIINSEIKIKFQTAFDLLEIRRVFEEIEEYVSKRMNMVGLFSKNNEENIKKVEEEIFNTTIEVNIKPLSKNDLSNDENLSVSLIDMEYLKPILV